LKFQSSAFTRIKLQIIPIILTATFLLLNSTPGQALWGEKIKKLDYQDLEQITRELRLYDDPYLPRYDDIFNSYYRDPKQLLNALNAKIEINQKMKKIARVVTQQKELDGLTYGVYIINAINEKRLVERAKQENFVPDQADGKFFGKLADDLADWKSQLGGSLLERLLQGVSATIGLTSLGLSSGITTLNLATNLVIIGLSINKLNKVLFENALWSYVLFRKDYNYEHQEAWEQYAESRIDQIVVLSPKKKQEMKEATEQYFWSLWMRYKQYILSNGLRKHDFEIKQRKELKTLVLYALGSKAHPVISFPLKITPSAPYQEGDKIKAEFTIKNKGNLPIYLKTLTVGGRYGNEQEVTDFTRRDTIMLDIDGSYNYEGTLTLVKTGKYHFFCAYQTPDGEWNTSVDLASGLTDEDRTEDITVKTEVAQDQEANKLYVEANQLYESAWQAESYSGALTLYKKALTKLETIISRYSSSNIAVELVKENTINELKYEILPWAILRADAEKSPFACAFYLIKKWYTGGGDPTDGFDELSTVATKYANIGQKDKALKILDELLSKAEQLRDYEYRGRALGILATRYAEIGEFEEALRIVDRNVMLIPLPTNHAELGQLDRALKIVQAIDWPRAKVEALVEIAGGYARLGQENKAQETYAEALALAQKGWNWVYARSWAFLKIASNYAELGERNKALEVLEEAFEAAKVIVDRNELLVGIAIEYVKLDQSEQALKAVEAMDSRPEKVEALVEIAGGYARLGQENKAAAVFEKAIDVADWEGGKGWVLTQIATKYTKLGQEDEALVILNEAMALASPPLAEIAFKYAELGLPDKALRIAEKLPSSWTKWRTFTEIAVKYAQLGKLEQVHDIILQIRYKKQFNTLEYTLHKLATTWAELSKFEQALQMVEQLSSEIDKAENLMEIDLAYAQLGQEIKKDQKDILNRIVRDTDRK